MQRIPPRPTNPVRIRVPVIRQPLLVIPRIHDRRVIQLLQGIDARDPLRLVLRLAQRWQKHPGENRDDGNDDEKLD